jgi:hypothetical protein
MGVPRIALTDRATKQNTATGNMRDEEGRGVLSLARYSSYWRGRQHRFAVASDRSIFRRLCGQNLDNLSFCGVLRR